MRSTISSSRLARLLGRWDAVADEPVRQDLAERLSQWLPVRDAISLDAAHRAIQALPAQWAAPRVRGPVPDALERELQRVRETLVQAIQAPPPRPAPPRRGRHALPQSGSVAAEPEDPLAPLRRQAADLQRQMGLRVDALRHHVRRQLAARSAALAQLAALDAAMEQMLAERLQKALATLPLLWERRCAQLRAQGQDGPAEAARALQELLLAELETRLEPVAGLIEAAARSAGPGKVTR